MPITRDQFEKGLDDTANKILRFLGENPNNAYEVIEVAQGIGEWNPPKDFGLQQLLYVLTISSGIAGHLNDLVNKGLVDKKMIGGSVRYAIRRK
jgi:uncharacterized protein YihD (DUF1040 family)